jgi:hypothetical protein
MTTLKVNHRHALRITNVFQFYRPRLQSYKLFHRLLRQAASQLVFLRTCGCLQYAGACKDVISVLTVCLEYKVSDDVSAV